MPPQGYQGLKLSYTKITYLFPPSIFCSAPPPPLPLPPSIHTKYKNDSPPPAPRPLPPPPPPPPPLPEDRAKCARAVELLLYARGDELAHAALRSVTDLDDMIATLERRLEARGRAGQ